MKDTYFDMLAEEFLERISQSKNLDSLNQAIHNLSSIASTYGVDLSNYTSSVCTAYEEDNCKNCNNPYGDGSDPTYVCSWYKEGKCTKNDGPSCKESYSTESLDG